MTPPPFPRPPPAPRLSIHHQSAQAAVAEGVVGYALSAEAADSCRRGPRISARLAAVSSARVVGGRGRSTHMGAAPSRASGA